jgi:hypothetical protein
MDPADEEEGLKSRSMGRSHVVRRQSVPNNQTPLIFKSTGADDLTSVCPVPIPMQRSLSLPSLLTHNPPFTPLSMQERVGREEESKSRKANTTQHAPKQNNNKRQQASLSPQIQTNAMQCDARCQCTVPCLTILPTSKSRAAQPGPAHPIPQPQQNPETNPTPEGL